MGRDLLMAQDFIDGEVHPITWLTGEPRVLENSHYLNSIEIIFQTKPGEVPWVFNLTVCLFSAVLVIAVATSFGTNPICE